MSKSRKGKQAIKNLTIKQFERVIEKRFNECPFDSRQELFEHLETWAKTELNEECCDMFLQALYGAKCTQEIQMTIALERALKGFYGKED